MAGKLFGTDGIRAVANTVLTPEMAFRLGRAVVEVLGSGSQRPRVLIGRDTRRSGEMLEAALAAGITSAGGDALSAGVIPTPAIALLLRDYDASCGVVISASHNPPEYNGLKVFSADGYKLDDADQDAIEALLTGPVDDPTARLTGAALGRTVTLPDATERYIRYMVDVLGRGALNGLKVAIDCGHGAAHTATPVAFHRLGAQVKAINADYNGDDINVGVGSTHMDVIADLVKSGDFDLGIAHDGDADRMLATDENGEIIDGDCLLAIAAKYLQDTDRLPVPVVVGTVMSNMGLPRALADLGIRFEATAVGDRYVLERMRETGAVLGGEQSGHVIYLQYNTTGDGLLSALMLAAAVKHAGKPASELARIMTRYPQVTENVTVTSKALDDNAAVTAAIQAAADALADDGRVLVRASGTEPLVRVMVEAADTDRAARIASDLAAVVQEHLG